MFPSLLSHELAQTRRDDLRRVSTLGADRPRRDPVVRPALAAAVERVAAAFSGLRPVARPQACVTC